jgi:outer membrane protein, heavy metal efflux system
VSGRAFRGALAAALLAALGGCAAAMPPDAGFGAVERLLSERLPGHQVSWNRGLQEDAAVEAAVRDLLADELSADGAVQVALVNNRGLRATYEDLGVSQADLVQAGLLSNPVFSASVRWTMNPAEGVNLGFGLVQSFVDLRRS